MNKYKLREILKKDFLKSRVKILWCVVFIMLTTSCSDFIDVSPEDRINAETFYSNTRELVFAVNGVYAAQRDIYGNLDNFRIVEARSDNVGQDQTDQKERIETDTFEETPGNLLLLSAWTRNYILINNANTVIARAVGIPTKDSTEEELKNRAIGEAKFLRAMSYFTLVNLFGDIPIRQKPTTDFENANLPRSPVSDVYAFIVSDLNEAINVLPNSYSGDLLSEVGRVTKFAAMTLLGKVQLQNGNKSEASSALQGVIDQYNLLAKYADIYAAGNNNTSESIFEVSFNPTNQTGLTMNNFFIPTSVASSLDIVAGGSSGKLTVFPTQDVLNIYEAGDLRAAASFALYENNGKMEPYISKYIDSAAAGNGSDINLVLLRYADVLLMKAEADGESTASYELINQVRRRAYGQDSNVADPTIDISAASPGTFSEKVMLESRREFLFEYHRWFDLKRLPDAEALSIINAHLAAVYTGVPTVEAYRLIYPIPQVEIDVSNNVVTQNSGYPN